MLGWPTMPASRSASAQVLTKSVSAGDSGSMQSVTPASAMAGRACRNVSAAQSNAWSRDTPGSSERCFGEPNTIRSPPKSRHASASATRYAAVRWRTSLSGDVR